MRQKKNGPPRGGCLAEILRGRQARGNAWRRHSAAYIALYREKHVSTVRAGTAANINRELEHMQDAWPGRSLRSISKKDVVAVIDKAMKRGPSAGDAQNRFIKIAQHYRTLADAEERDAERKGIERRSITSDKLGRAE